MDPTDDFAYVDHGWNFLNTTLAYPANLVGVPVYPDPAFGGAAFWELESGAFLQLGLFDGAFAQGVPTGSRGPGTLFGSPADLAWLGEAGWAGEDLRAFLGGWRHTGRFPRSDGGVDDGASGWYLGAEGMLWTELPDPEDEQGLAGIVRASQTDDAISAVGLHLAAALVWYGPVSGRDQDEFGFSWLRAGLSDAPGAAFPESAETVWEAYYRLPLTPFCALSPSFQLVQAPSGRFEDAWVPGVRLEVAF